MALVLGTNCGFVTEAPTSDPGGYSEDANRQASVTKHISPAGAAKITEIGFWLDNATQEENFEVGIYSDDGTNWPNLLLEVERTNAKGTAGGVWKRVSVDWSISPNTTYWIAIQIDGVSTTQTNWGSGPAYSYAYQVAFTLAGDWETGDNRGAGIYSIYAVWEAGEPTGTNIKIHIGEDWKDVDSMKIHIGNAWKDVVEVKQHIGNEWLTVY